MSIDRWIPDTPHRIAIGCLHCPNEALKCTSYTYPSIGLDFGMAYTFCWLCVDFQVFPMTIERFESLVYPDPTVSHRNILNHLKRNGDA